MSWLFSRALVEAFSEATSSDGEPCAQLNVMPSPRPFWRKDKTMDVLKRSPFGLTWRPLTADRGEALLTWYRAGFPARTFPAPARGLGSTARKAASGARCGELLARFDRASCSWRTLQCSLFEAESPSLETLPRWGMWDGGALYQLPTPSGLSAFRAMIDRHLTISANACGSSQRMPTATKFDATGNGNLRADNNPAEGGMHGASLHHAVMNTQRMPTPKATEAGPDFAKMDRSSTGISLQTAVAMTQRAPSPLAGDASGSRSSKGKDRPDECGLAGWAKTTRAPTPRSEDSQCAGGHRGNPDTPVAFTRMPTATTQDASNCGGPSQSYRNSLPLNAVVGGQLNPQWEDWFMGWPIGWTDVGHSATDRFRQWRDSHG